VRFHSSRPTSVLAEFLSLLAKRNRRKQISDEQAREAFQLMQQCAPRLFDTRPLLPEAFELSLRFQLSLWDCVYLALAVQHDCPLLTADRRFFEGSAGRHANVRLLQRPM
jgi:predicted nucleic acid-binding protein